jgi:YVTN family beta-propeller protein
MNQRQYVSTLALSLRNRASGWLAVGMPVGMPVGMLAGVMVSLALMWGQSFPALAETPKISTRWPIEGAGGWDYLTLDSAHSRLYVSRADHVDVVDTQSGNVMAVIHETQGVHGVAIAADLGVGFVSNGRNNNVSVFELKSSTRIQDVPVEGVNPDAILYEASTQQLYTFNGKSQDVSVLDAKTYAIKAHIKVPGKPEFAQTDNAGHVYVNIETEPGQLVRIDSKSLTIDATWPLTGCNSPTGLSLDNKHHRLFSVCDDKVMVVTDAQSGKQVAKVTIGTGPDAVGYDAKHQRVYVTNGQGTLSIIAQKDADHYEVLPELATERGARTLALDEGSGKIFSITAQFVPAEPSPSNPKGRPQVVPGSIHLLVIDTH